MKSQQIRQGFIDYFVRHGHRALPSSSLIPESDPTLLFANAGMNQFKNLFLGLEQKDFKRAVTSQKCVRAGGKHNDLENVGFTARHHTFFEMLGNFSFGDYFKKDAIHFAWELLTKELAIPKDKLYVTVFQNDDEAADIWHKQEGVPRERIFRFGEKDNFWRMGDTGPCGPCTEIFYDHGARAGKESDPFKGIAAGEDRFVEIWNLVFMQFFEKSPGVMEPLPKPSVDTGSGLERVTAALQGKLNNYNTDLFWPMIQRAAEISHKENLLKEIDKVEKEGIHANISPEIRENIAALRVVADHVRSCSFLIADGALPSNEGRGYVLRRILRRGVRFSQKLSGKDAFLPEISKIFINEMAGIYLELKQRKDVILATITDEQDRFMASLGNGTQMLEEEFKKLKSKNQKTLSGETLFRLYDTFGFPSDLTRVMAEEKGFQVDEAEFDKLMEAAKNKAKASWKGKAISADEGHLIQMTQRVFDQYKSTRFLGYETLSAPSTALILSDGKAEVKSLSAGQTGFVIFEQTPFYAEGGGQVGDQGTFTVEGGVAEIHNTTKKNEIFIHHIEVKSGTIKTSQQGLATVHNTNRRQITAHHSATHLLHAALRKVLGTHVNQAGSLVDESKLRFDFTHNKSLTPQEIYQIESLVNEQVSQSLSVTPEIASYQQAIQSGAIALFGEKYGDRVRVLRMGDFSCELCGGTHVSNTSQIRAFKIMSESGVSSGVRRIEAISGDLAVQFLMKSTFESQIARSVAGINENWSQILQVPVEKVMELPLVQWIEDKKTEVKKLEKEFKKSQSAQVDLGQLVSAATSFQSSVGPAQMVFADVNLDDKDVLAQLTDQIKNKIQRGIVILIGEGDQTHPLVVSVTKDLNPKFSAGQILKEIAATMGGKGGGRPDFAQGSVPKRDQLSQAKAKALEMLKA